jgi:hypothetical protein
MMDAQLAHHAELWTVGLRLPRRVRRQIVKTSQNQLSIASAGARPSAMAPIRRYSGIISLT